MSTNGANPKSLIDHLVRDQGFRFDVLPKTQNGVSVLTVLREQGFSLNEAHVVICILNHYAEQSDPCARKYSLRRLQQKCGCTVRTLQRMHLKPAFIKLMRPKKKQYNSDVVMYNIQGLLVALNEQAKKTVEDEDDMEDVTSPEFVETTSGAEDFMAESNKDQPFAAQPAEPPTVTVPKEIAQVYRVSEIELQDPIIIEGASVTLDQFVKLRPWFFAEIPPAAWYDRLKKEHMSDPNYELRDLRDTLWFKLQEMQQMLDEREEDTKLTLRHFVTLVSWFVDRRTVNNINHALGDHDSWRNALSLWHMLGCNLEEINNLEAYVDGVFSACLESGFRLAGEAFISLGREYKSSSIDTSVPVVAWLKDLYDRGKDVESKLSTLDTGEFFQEWCKLKIKKLRENNPNFKIYPAAFTNWRFDPDDDAVRALAAASAGSAAAASAGSAAAASVGDEWGEVKQFLGLGTKCGITWLPKGWALSESHIKLGGTTSSVTSINGPEYFVGTTRYLAIFHHSDWGTNLAIRITPQNFAKYKHSWFDNALIRQPPTLSEMVCDGVCGKQVDAVTGEWKYAGITQVVWRTE